MADSGNSDHASPDQILNAALALLHVVVERAPVAADLQRAIELMPWPVAVLRGADPVTNTMWRGTFGTTDPLPAALATSLAAPATGHVQELALELPYGVRYYSAAIRDGIVVAIDVTDEALARRLGATEDALVWSGPVDEPPTYYGRRWRALVAGEWRDAIHRADAARWLSSLRDAGHRRAHVEIEARLRRRDDGFRWYRFRFTRDGDQVLGCATDIHSEHGRDVEREQLADQVRNARADVERAHRLRDDMLSLLSHELRAPLATLLLWEQVLRENAADPAARQRALDAIHSSATAQERMFSDLLDVARGLTGKLYLDSRVVELKAVVTDAVDAARPAALAKSIELVSSFTSLAGNVRADPRRLRQVLDHLLTNAIKFTAPQGKVVVSTTRVREAFAIEVADTGRGIAPELMKSMFEPFGREVDVRRRSEGGLGLGLALSKLLVDLHHGTLVAASDGPDKGARFTLTLPSEDRWAASSVPPPAPQRPSHLEGTRVLVIDDDPRVRDALAVLLTRVGVVVETADSAESGRASIAAMEPQVVICDIAMPGEDGYSFARSLRAAGSKLPSIALTGYAEHVDAQLALEAGFDVHITKPVSIASLIDTLNGLLANR